MTLLLHLFGYTRSNDMVLLVSFAGQEEFTQLELTAHPRRVYAIISLRHLPGSFHILKVRAVPYQSVSPLCSLLIRLLTLLLDL